MKKIILLLVIISVAILGFVVASFFQKPKTAKAVINGQEILIQIASTDQQKIKGLAGRTSLGKNEGMLFPFDSLGKYIFTMKGMNFPLDFIWIKGDKIVDINEDMQPARQNEISEFAPNAVVDKVLEVNAGTIKLLGAKIGDKISLNY